MDNQTKGIAFIIGGVISYFILPQLLYSLEIYFIGSFFFLTLALLLAIFGIAILVENKREKANNENDLNESSFSDSSLSVTATEVDVNPNMPTNNIKKMSNTNKIINVYLAGGIIGVLGVSPHLALHNAIKKENEKGWKVVQIIPASSGNVFLTILRYILLVCTLLFYTTTNGYYVILEKIEK